MTDFRVPLLGGILMLAACAASQPPPTPALLAAESIITQAEQASVAHYTSPELTRARVSLAAARSAVEKGQMLLALQLAERARLDAQLAIARTEEARVERDTGTGTRDHGSAPGPMAWAAADDGEAAVGLWRNRRIEVTVANVLASKR
jgi:hypothetical protein